MAVAEPPSDFGFWPKVRALSGWPDTDETSLGAMSAAWAGGAGGLEQAASVNFDGVQNSWDDAVGRSFASEMRGISGTVDGHAQDMRQLETYTDDAEAVVLQTKVEINDVIRSMAPTYGAMEFLPPGIRQAVQPAWIVAAARIVIKLIERAARWLSRGPKVKDRAPRPPATPTAPRLTPKQLDDAITYAKRPAKLDHVFVPKHKLDAFVQQSGGREAAMERIMRSLDPPPGPGIFEVQRDIGGHLITIRGFVVDGVPKIGTAFIP
ncbi:WXG100-like domain-containing protein [Actinophytocola gossypii]|uniref:Outer membrane channel protein CpnT-like N-terminal domain-containing protein n=1 Tax=Actinophytocola gossypii TaxID=2812003 RepID=A0ABT2JFL2_9PSEU|nr:hypothetical protein [Actinophytocola gossypii]MCT2586648.1 hypothetical protein [Actinophytocola gossypii]